MKPTAPHVRVLVALALVVTVIGSGCGLFGGGPKTLPEVVSEETRLVLKAREDLNNCGEGPANAIGIRIYQLAADAGIAGVPQAALWENDEAELGQDLLDKQELFLDPGSQTTLEFRLKREAMFLAVVGNFCRTDGDCWRWVKPSQDLKKEIHLQFGSTCVDEKR